ncbi:M48 family metalloprotease [Micromonospora carbonacea]|uniref:M48 family metalloprotease n=1 Tax=Micromonospora carbonacea TaxID=47853 RepID=UPI0033C7E8B1
MTTPTIPAAGRGFGAGTTPRFLLLSALVLITAVRLFERLNAVLFYAPSHDLLGGIGCYLAAGEDPAGDHVANQQALQRPGVREALESCLDLPGQRDPVWPLVVEMGLLVVAAAVLYFVLPLWRSRPGRVVELDERIDPSGELRELVHGLVGVAGLTRPPRFVVDPAARTPGAVVFGRWGRYTVCLHGGLLVRRVEDPLGFRAVVLHELAHLRNRDVDITYATVALWRVFLVVLPAGVLLSIAYLRPAAPSLFAAQNHRSSLQDLFATAFLVVLVYLARAEVLRVRELHADLGAVQSGADPQAWHRDARPPRRPAARLLRWISGPWRTHPDGTQRQLALSDPTRVFAVPRLPVFFTGVTVLVVVGTARSSQAVTQRVGIEPVTTAASALGAALATAVVGAVLWQSAVHTPATSRPRAPAVRTGFWFGAGLVTGELALDRVTDGWLPERPQFLLVLLLIGVVIMWWTAEHVDLWAHTRRGRRSRPAVLLTLTATGLVFGTWFAWWQSEGQWWVQGRPIVDPQGVLRLYDTQLPGLLDANSGPLALTAATNWVLGRLGTDQSVLPGAHGLLLAGALLWLLPLTTALSRNGTGLPLRRIVTCAACGGLLAVAALAVVRLLLHDAVAPGPGRPAALLLHDSTWTVAVLTAAAAVAGGTAGARSSRYRLPTGLATAGITMLSGQLASFVLESADGCWGPFDVLTDSCGWRPGGGWSYVAGNTPELLGPGIFLVAAALLVLAGRRERPEPPAQSTMPRPRLVVSVVAVTVVVLGAASWKPAVRVSSPTAGGIALTAADLPVASSPTIHRLRVLAWLKYGGQRLLDDISGKQNTFTVLVTTPPLTYRDVVDRVRPLCLDIERDVAAARAYFPVPDDEAWRDWTAYLDDSARAAVTCRQAVDANDVALFRSAGQQMQQTFFSHRKIYDRLQPFLR